MNDKESAIHLVMRVLHPEIKYDLVSGGYLSEFRIDIKNVTYKIDNLTWDVTYFVVTDDNELIPTRNRLSGKIMNDMLRYINEHVDVICVKNG